jgi:hypothetical protein
MNVSEKGLKFIIDAETGGEAYYNKKLKRPSWPGASSGVTIGAGYDLGYNTVSQLCEDWDGNLDGDHIEDLKQVCGIKGAPANELAKGLSHIEVPWESAVAVFNKCTVPRFYAQMVRIYPEAATIDPDAACALLSLVFNRGSSLNGERRKEMADIQTALKKNDLPAIVGLLREQKRLWPDSKGLRNRRDAEADFFHAAIA